jgi:peptidoglycan/xylan/chitin deacetylase (PgdA/CDA1 family)
MKRFITVFWVTILILGSLTSCSPAKTTTPPVELSVLEIHLAGTTAPVLAATPSPTPVPTPMCTPVPGIEAEWYVERNEQIKVFLKRDQPALSNEEVNEKVGAMYIDPSKPMVALTFDDGPVPGVTDKILDILERYNVRATFFVCGWRYKNEEAPAISRRALALGCELGNHTYLHSDLRNQSKSEKLWAIENNNKVVFEATGYTMRELRPPGGHNDYEVNDIAAKDDMAVVLWAQSGNVHEQDPEKIAQNVEKQIVNDKELQDGDIILLHDTKPQMVDAVEIVIPMLLEKGFQLVTVWELLNCSESGFVPGETYRCQDSLMEN